MLDLNVAAPCDGDGVEVDDHHTSNSSVLNAESSNNTGDEESCSTTPAGQHAFRFGILKDWGNGVAENVEGGERFVEEEVNNSDFILDSRQSHVVTREVFAGVSVHPEGARGGVCPRALEMATPPILSSGPETHWVGFNFRQADVAAQPEERIKQQEQQPVKKSRRGPRSRSSQYRGVTFYRRTGRWESHIWDCGKQVYLGGFDTAHAAARAYDRAAIKFRGVDADINFNLSDYDEDLKQMQNLTKEEFVHVLRRQSTGFSRGSSKYRGVTLHKCGRWEARMGQFLGKKAYDKAAIKCNGREAVTNFEPSYYEGELALEMDTEAIGRCIDLDLKISQPVIHSGSHYGDTVGTGIQRGFSEAGERRQPVQDDPTLLLARNHGFRAGLEGASMYSDLCPGSVGNFEGQAGGRVAEVGSQAFPNWTRQVHGSIPSSVFPSAASSGFPATTATAAALLPPPPAQQPAPSIYHHYPQFHPSTAPQYYRR